MGIDGAEVAFPHGRIVPNGDLSRIDVVFFSQLRHGLDRVAAGIGERARSDPPGLERLKGRKSIWVGSRLVGINNHKARDILLCLQQDGEIIGHSIAVVVTKQIPRSS